MTFLDPPDEIIEDDPEDDGSIEQITQAYAHVPDIDPDKPEVPLPEFYFCSTGTRCS